MKKIFLTGVVVASLFVNSFSADKYPFVINVNKKYIYVNNDGTLAIPKIFQQAFDFSSNGFARVKINNKYSFIDKNGKTLSEEDVNKKSSSKSATENENYMGVYPELINDKYGYIDQKTKKIVIEAKFDSAENFSKNGLAAVGIRYEKSGLSKLFSSFNKGAESTYTKYGYIDTKGIYVIEPKFDGASNFDDNGLARVVIDGDAGVINEKGEWIIKLGKFPNLGNFGKNGLAWVSVTGYDDGAGYINTKGEWVVEPYRYSQLYPFDEKNNLARVQSKDWKYGYINAKGEVAIEPKYYYAFDFESNGLAKVQPYKDPQCNQPVECGTNQILITPDGNEYTGKAYKILKNSANEHDFMMQVSPQYRADFERKEKERIKREAEEERRRAQERRKQQEIDNSRPIDYVSVKIERICGWLCSFKNLNISGGPGNFSNSFNGADAGAIHKGYNGQIAGRYTWSAEASDGSEFCSGSFYVSGKKRNVTINVYKGCSDPYINEF